MRSLIDIDALESEGILTPDLAATLRLHAKRDSGSTAINMLLAFGVIAIGAGFLGLEPAPWLAAVMALGVLILGFLVRARFAQQWDKLASIWILAGALTLSVALPMAVMEPMAYLAFADGPAANGLGLSVTIGIPAAIVVMITAIGLLGRSHLLMMYAAWQLSALLGSFTGYRHAMYAMVVPEPFLMILLMSAAAAISLRLAQRSRAPRQRLLLTYSRMSVVMANIGFWIGSLWGDPVTMLTGDYGYEGEPLIPAIYFSIVWAVVLVGLAIWAGKTGRRFLVNLVAVFGAIHFYTQWFERLGAEPASVMLAGLAAIGIGLALWQYNRRFLSGAEGTA